MKALGYYWAIKHTKRKGIKVIQKLRSLLKRGEKPENEVKKIIADGSESIKLLNLVSIFKEISEHRQEQDKRFSWISMSFADQLAVLVEEVGEVAREANEFAQDNCSKFVFRKQARAELIQVAAVAIRMIEDLDHGADESDDLINDR